MKQNRAEAAEIDEELHHGGELNSMLTSFPR